MQITVFGAGGRVGRRVVEQALGRGYQVVALVHDHDPFSGTPDLVVQKGDIYKPRDIAKALKGSDAVISVLGSWKTKRRDVLSSAMAGLIPAMEAQGIGRIVTLTGTGALAPGETEKIGHRLTAWLLRPFPAGKVFADGERHMRLLADSRLDWTALRSPVMTKFGAKTYRLDGKSGSPLETIRYDAVATALLDEVTANEYLGQTPVLHRE